MSAVGRLRWIAQWIVSPLETSTTGCYAVAEFAAPSAEFQSYTKDPTRSPHR